MLYLTAGLQDVGIKPDVEVESACVKQFAVETSDFVTRRCLDMLGAQTNLRDSPFQQFLAENQVLQSWQGSNNILKCFIAISGKSCSYLHLRYFFLKLSHSVVDSVADPGCLSRIPDPVS
jgi:hypothetical protein